MTVIAFDGTTLVADGRATSASNSLVSDCVRKLHRIKIKEFGGECIVGLCGGLDGLGPFLNHLEQNGLVPMEHFKTSEEMQDDWYHMRGIAVNKKGQAYEITTDGAWFPINGAWATGSGSTIAQHYLVKGCSALEAVQETCKTELSCGGNLLTFDWKSGTFTEYPATKPSEAPTATGKPKDRPATTI